MVCPENNFEQYIWLLKLRRSVALENELLSTLQVRVHIMHSGHIVHIWCMCGTLTSALSMLQ
jgi:hypothetical protein